MREQQNKRWRQFFICLALGLITIALYLPSLKHDFLTYDDQQYVTENSRVRAGLSGPGLVWAFGYHAGNWHPLTWLSHMLDCQLYGLKPAGHHLTNVLLHAGSTILLFLIFYRMTGAEWKSASVAALFGWHPLHVESVAWVAERKDVLSAFFWMLTLGAYTRYVEELKQTGISQKTKRVWYVLTLLMFIFGLMSKPMLVTLPFVLLVLDYWPLRRIEFKRESSQIRILASLVLEKAPFFAFTVGACFLTVSAQQLAIVSTAGLPVSQRICHAILSYVHYLGATFIPVRLSVYYPYEINPPISEIIFAGILLLLITVAAARWTVRHPYFLVGWLWFLGTLVPVIGLVQVGDQAWADRYTYLPLVGLFIAIIWGLAEFVSRRGLLCSGAAAISLVMLTLTSLQLRHWKNTRTLFAHADRVVDRNYMAITVLGSEYAKEGKLEEAIAHYKRALSLKPGFPEAHFFLGNAYDNQGKLDAAISEYKRAVWFKPMQEQAHLLLGVALAKQKKFDEAISHYKAALELNPESAVAHNNIARAYHTQGRLNEAVEHYSTALKLDAGLAQAHNNLGILLLQKGDLAGGTTRLREALRLNPDNPESQYNLALALNQQEQWSEAATLFAKVISDKSNDPETHSQFAKTLSHLQKTREAMSHYASALMIQPNFVDALDGLSWILATDPNPQFRNGTEAVRMAERANEMMREQDPRKIKTLAEAYAETGRFADATATIQKALLLASKQTDKRLVGECESMLMEFRLERPWRSRTERVK